MTLLYANAYEKLIIIWRLKHNDNQLMIMCSVLNSYCVCRMPSWIPKTQPNGSSAVVWLSFWCSTRFTRKSVSANAETHVRLHFYIFDYVVFEQPLKPKRLFSAKIPYLYIWSSWTSTGNPTWSVGSNTNRLLISTDWCHNINKIVLKSLLLSLEGMYLTSYV